MITLKHYPNSKNSKRSNIDAQWGINYEQINILDVNVFLYRLSTYNQSRMPKELSQPWKLKVRTCEPCYSSDICSLYKFDLENRRRNLELVYLD